MLGSGAVGAPNAEAAIDSDVLHLERRMVERGLRVRRPDRTAAEH